MTALPTHLFEALDHVGIAVTDLDEAIAFYRDTYGMTLAHEETNPEQGVREAMMTVGDPQAPHAHIQLLAPLSPDSSIGRFLDRSGPGIQQMAYTVETSFVDAATDAFDLGKLRHRRSRRLCRSLPSPRGSWPSTR